MSSYGSTPLPSSAPAADEEAKPFMSTRQLVVGVAVCATLAVAGVVGLKSKRECLHPWSPSLLPRLISFVRTQLPYYGLLPSTIGLRMKSLHSQTFGVARHLLPELTSPNP